jgi:flagellar P-ring protein precursor FlgI
VLLVTPLRAGDQNVYAVAQGPVTIGSMVGGNAATFPTVGRVVVGATIEKDLEVNFSEKKSFRLSLHNPDFTTTARVVALINGELGGKFARARDSGTIDVVVPFNYDGNSVELLAKLEAIQVNVDNRAKVILNERTGTVVMGEQITISAVAISHGDLTIAVEEPVRGPAQAGPQQPGAQGAAQVNRVAEIPKATKVSDLVRVLNALGVRPKDLTAIFQTMSRLGAIQAELEIM